MKEYLKQGAVIAVLVFFAVFGAVKLAIPQNASLGGDFPGGIAPSNLFTSNVAGGYIQPVGSFAVAAPNGTYVGGTSQYNQQTLYVTASGTPSVVVSLNSFGTATGTAATSSITVPNSSGLSIGAICSGGTNTTTVAISSCLLSTTDGVTGTALVAYSNMTNASLSVPTSTRFNLTFDQLPY